MVIQLPASARSLYSRRRAPEPAWPKPAAHPVRRPFVETEGARIRILGATAQPCGV